MKEATLNVCFTECFWVTAKDQLCYSLPLTVAMTSLVAIAESESTTGHEKYELLNATKCIQHQKSRLKSNRRIKARVHLNSICNKKPLFMVLIAGVTYFISRRLSG